jgi:hypothetical protein
MSEYQFVHFLAIDRPLDEKQLEFMERQSSRAEITQWSFTNEYHYGDFHGNAPEMLRRGYDIHLHYANYGIRKLMIRLPGGLPCERSVFDAFCLEYGIEWKADKKGNGGILEIEPEADAGSYDEGIWDAAELLPRIAPIREQLMSGDLRPLYLAWLACCQDEDLPEPPVPAGLSKPTRAMTAMAEFYEIGDDMIAAAAQQSPPLPKLPDAETSLTKWIAKQSPANLRALVESLLGADASSVRVETLARIREDMGAATWPLAESTRTLGQLHDLARALGEKRRLREKNAKDAARRKRLAAIAADPDRAVADIEKLVEERSTNSYEQAAAALLDLREALGPELGPARATALAEGLRRQKPRSNLLIHALRKHGLLA